jgi:hypothetical protein
MMSSDLVPRLDPELEALLLHLVEASRRVERAQRSFFASRAFGMAGLGVLEGGLTEQYQVAEHDLDELARYGLIEITDMNVSGTFRFYITQHGYAYADEVQQQGEPLERMAEDVQTYLDSDDFRTRHSAAYAKWKQAADYLATDPTEHATRIGHDCREALSVFASRLLAQHEVTNPGEGTHAAIRTVIDARRDMLGKRTQALLASLLDLWRAASGIAQRQEHALSSEAEFDANDARRCVFYTGLVMYELDHTLE